MGLISTIAFIHQHPLNRDGRIRALGRFARWQLASRLVGGSVALPFVDKTSLFVDRGMTGATGNWYCGLHEHDDMGFVLHFLRQDDVFFDVGANVGSYTVLAAGACGVRTVSFEPIPTTFEALRQNVRLNDLDDHTTIFNMAVGASSGKLEFTSDLGCMNRALQRGEVYPGAVSVEITTIDAVAADDHPTMCKIDVEGFEAQVLAGGVRALSSPTLRSVLMEINGSGRGFGIEDGEIHAAVCQHGFVPVRYDALTRTVEPIQDGGWSHHGGNTIYVRDLNEVRERVRGAKRFKLVNSTI